MNAKQHEILHQAKVKIYVAALFSSIWIGSILWILFGGAALFAGLALQDHGTTIIFVVWPILVAIVYAILYAKSQPKIRLIQRKIENASSAPPQ